VSDSIESIVVDLLQRSGKRIAIAESCTGGRISSRITDVSGASTVFSHGYITYSNEAKTDMLGVDASLITAHGAVSEQVAIAMAEGARLASGADIAIAVTGIAGPTGGSDEKPVGTVWLGVSTSSKNEAVHAFYPSGREEFKQQVSQKALELVRALLT